MSIFDMLLANAMGEGGGGGGGGGSSDFSTAQVTIYYESEWQPLGGAFVVDENEFTGSASGPYLTQSGETATVILYKGKASVWSSEPVTSTSGAIEYDEAQGVYIITGDCSITCTKP